MVDEKTNIDADKATAYFEPKERTLTEVFCEGNVKITRGKDISYADELTYLAAEGRVILSGRPKIIISETSELLKSKKEE